MKKDMITTETNKESIMKVAIGGFFHETNTYATTACGETTLDNLLISRGQDLIDFHSHTAFGGGFVDGPIAKGWELVPTVCFRFDQSFGTINLLAYQKAKKEFLDRIKAAMPLDAVLLMNHGGGIVEEIGDLEGDIVASVRELVGPDVKLVSTLDLHGKLSPKSEASYDFINGNHLYPHTDTEERNLEVVELLPSIISGEIKPTLHSERLPISFAVMTTDAGSFSHEIMKKVVTIHKRDDVLQCTVLHGFPCQDSEFVQMNVMVTTDNDPELAKQLSTELAQWIWDNREKTLFDQPNPEECIAIAAKILQKSGTTLLLDKPKSLIDTAYGFIPLPDRPKPIVVCDYSDNPGSGAAGDTTWLLQAMIDAKLNRACMISIQDPETVAQAVAAGTGQTIKVRLGGKKDIPERGGVPIEAEAYVKSISDGKVTDKGVLHSRLDMGQSVRLIIGGIDVIVVDGYSQSFDDSFGRDHGIRADEYNFVAVKSANHFRFYYGSITDDDRIMIADTPGLGQGHVELYKYTKLPYPVYPHNDDAQYPIVYK
jgi:microcystin degradation protein MlrC